MKQIVIEIDDEAFEPFMGVLRLCPSVKVVGTNSFAEPQDMTDQCFAEAVKEVVSDKNLYKRPSDLAYIMIAANDGAINGLDYYLTPDDFIGYLQQIGVEQLPKRSTIYNKVNDTVEKFPNWNYVHRFYVFQVLLERLNAKSWTVFWTSSQKLDRFLDNTKNGHYGLEKLLYLCPRKSDDSRLIELKLKN